MKNQYLGLVYSDFVWLPCNQGSTRHMYRPCILVNFTDFSPGKNFVSVLHVFIPVAYTLIAHVLIKCFAAAYSIKYVNNVSLMNLFYWVDAYKRTVQSYFEWASTE